MKKKSSIINFGIVAFFIALMFVIISIGSVSGDLGRHFGPLVMDETEAAAVGLEFIRVSDPSIASDRPIKAYYYDDEREADYLTIHFDITLSKCEPSVRDSISFEYVTDACICPCKYPRCEKELSIGEDEDGMQQYIPAGPCYEKYENGYTNYKGSSWETVFVYNDILVKIESGVASGIGNLNDYDWCKSQHDRFVKLCAEKIRLNYPLVLTHTAFAYLEAYDYGADSGNELIAGGSVSGPDGELADVRVEYIIYYIDSTTERLFATTDTTGTFKVKRHVVKEIDHIDFKVTNEDKFPKYESMKTITVGDLAGQPPIGDKEVQIETNPATGKPFVGVGTDGVSTLKFVLSFPGCTNTKIFVKPKYGKFEGDCIDPDRMIQLDSKGQAEITYRPRRTVHSNYFTPHLDVHKSGPKVGACGERLRITYVDAYGRDGETITNFLVCRPPIILVHGFLGGPETWIDMSDYLQGKGYDTYLGDYGATNQEIEGLAGILKIDIQFQKRDYAKANIKMAKVDIIAHSMGGLISRYYTHDNSSYLHDVRKLITIGTPHHGTWLHEAKAAEYAASWYETHKDIAKQLHTDSPFLEKLNKGEKTRGHLNPEVQHGNIYGFPSDLIVSADSAYLNGVVNHIVTDVKHSVDIPLSSRKAITVSVDIQKLVGRWLQTDLIPQRLKGMNAKVRAFTGDVYIDEKYSTSKKVKSLPATLLSYNTLRTEHDSTAIVHLALCDEVWGIITLDQDSEIMIGEFSPQSVEICLSEGSATYSSSSKDTPVKIKKVKKDEWWKHYPEAIVRGLGTEFNIVAGDAIEIHCLEGTLTVDTANATEGSIILSVNESMTVEMEVIIPISHPVKVDSRWSAKNDDFKTANVTVNESDEIVDTIENVEYVCSQNLTEAYRQYIFAYNKLLYLTKNREDGSPEVLAAYEMYVKTKACYENISARTSYGIEQPSHTPNDTVQQLYPVADGDVYKYAYQNWNWANWGMFTSMAAGWNPTGGEKCTYLKFDIPSDIDIDCAILKLYQYHNAGAIRDLNIHRVTNSWDEGTSTYHYGMVEKTVKPNELCWMQQPSFDPWYIVSFTPATKFPEWVEVDITSLVLQWQSGTPNYGLLIKTSNKNPTLNDPEAMAMFYSKEHPDQSSHPVLEISTTP